MPGGSGQPISASTCPTKYAVQIKFGILSAEEVRELAVCDITNEMIYGRDGKPTQNGINDLRMGTMDLDQICRTCGCNYIDCPGHFGKISLPLPIFHPGYLTTVIKILKCICVNCGKLKLRNSKQRYEILRKASARTRFKKTFELCSKIKDCEPDKESNIGCKHKQPKLTREGLTIWKYEESQLMSANDPKKLFTADDILQLFKKITDTDEIRMLGMDKVGNHPVTGKPEYARPEWMIIQELAVAPPPVRPSVDDGGGARSNDDLTMAYKEVIRKSNELRQMIADNQTEQMKQDCLSNLQVHVATLMDNNQPDTKQQRLKGGRAIKCIRSRLKGKEGRVRGNLMGKRVDHSARSVITPDPILQLDQLGVPERIAINLTRPEHVTKNNLEDMKQLVYNGPNQWPGAKFIIRPDGKQIDLAFKKNRADSHLSEGYIVERHLRDNDFVVFNRQPSLHKMSMMGHRVKVLPFQTFRLNLSVTSPYNADFDGDEMNMHVPQSFETMAEIKEIMHVPKQVVAPKNNSPVMGIVQDSLLGISQLTKRDTFVELDQMMNLMMWVGYEGALPTPAIIRPRPLWTGKQVISLVIPKINLSRGGKDGWCCPKDSNVLVKEGELLCGIFNKKIVGAGGGGIVHLSWRDLGPEACKMFLSDAQNIVNNWLVEYGFSVGVQDIVPDVHVMSNIENTLEKYKRKVKRIVQQTQRGQLETLPGKKIFETFEVKVNQILNAAREQTGKMAKEALPSYNRLFNMVDSGSKGSHLNISQIMACVGQQNVEGKRITFGFNRRSLPHFSKDDYGPESKGFVSNCFFTGLTPQEFYFHAMGGREGVIDTACKTAETGYIQRRLIKALEDVQVKYDQTVRTARDQIIQFVYGEDGMDAHFIEGMQIPLLLMDNKKMEKEFQIFKPNSDESEMKNTLKQFVYANVVDDIQDFEGIQEKLYQEFQQLKKDREALRTFIIKSDNEGIHLPVHVPRLIQLAKYHPKVKARGKSDLTPDYVFDQVQALLDSYNEKGIKVYQPPRLGSSDLFHDANENATWLSKIYMRSMLSVKNIIQNQRMNKENFDWLCGEIKDRYLKALVHPGEMAGCIGAQSMGEPATQMTLNTFHMAGVASKNVTLGVPRLREIINIAKNIKTPSLRIFLEPEYRNDQEKVRQVGNLIEYTNLSHVVATSSIYYDPNPEKTVIEADEELLSSFLDSLVDQDEYINQSKMQSRWLIRFELDKEKIISRGISIEIIDDKIQSKLHNQNSFAIIRNYDHEDLKKLVLRLRLPHFENSEDRTVPMILREAESLLLNELTLKGIPQITKASYSKESNYCKFDVFDPVTGKHSKNKDNIIIETDGVALKDVLSMDLVDPVLTTSNDILEIFQVLGIEATRMSLITELRFVLGSYDIYVNYRHLSTLCDVMTTRGVITSITRHGINRVDSGALRKASFEETVEILLESSFHGEVDPLAGITENIIMGQLAPYGTGCFDLMLDCTAVADTNTVVVAEEKISDLSSESSSKSSYIHGYNTPKIITNEQNDDQNNFNSKFPMSIYKQDDEPNNMLSPVGIIPSPSPPGMTNASPIYKPVNSPFYIDAGAQSTYSAYQPLGGPVATNVGYSPTPSGTGNQPNYRGFAGSSSPMYSPQQARIPGASSSLSPGIVAQPQYRPTAVSSPMYNYRNVSSPQYQMPGAGGTFGGGPAFPRVGGGPTPQPHMGAPQGSSSSYMPQGGAPGSNLGNPNVRGGQGQ